MLLRSRKFILLAVIFTLTGSLYGWWQKDELLGWYYFRQLSYADGDERETWVKKLVALDQAVQPRALECLRSSHKKSCGDGEEVLIGLAKNWKDVRAANLLKEVLVWWPTFSEPGRTCALTVARVVLEESGEQSPLGFECTLARDLLQCAETDTHADRALLPLALVLVRLEPKEMPRPLLAAVAHRGLRCPDYDVRAMALRLFLQDPVNKDAEFLSRAVPFLQDVAPEVRRVALLAVGSNKDVVTDDELLPLLHDADAEVCRFCELALRSRGLNDRHIFLARLISDERATARLEVLEYLDHAGDLDPGVWLRRLCQDAAPAVRAAAVRAAGTQDVVDLRDRLRDMAQNDASPTVRQLAGHYLRRNMIGQPGDSRYTQE